LHPKTSVSDDKAPALTDAFNNKKRRRRGCVRMREREIRWTSTRRHAGKAMAAAAAAATVAVPVAVGYCV